MVVRSDMLDESVVESVGQWLYDSGDNMYLCCFAPKIWLQEIERVSEAKSYELRTTN